MSPAKKAAMLAAKLPEGWTTGVDGESVRVWCDGFIDMIPLNKLRAENVESYADRLMTDERQVRKIHEIESAMSALLEQQRAVDIARSKLERQRASRAVRGREQRRIARQVKPVSRWKRIVAACKTYINGMSA